MAESIFIYFSNTNWKEVKQVVEKIARTGKTSGAGGLEYWVYPPTDDNLVLLYEYNDIFNEFEPDEVSRVKAAFGGLPSTVLCIELRRSKVDAAVDCAEKLTVLFLKRFSGLADEHNASFRSLEEITQGVQKGGLKFLDCYRQEFLWRDRPPSA